jgi:hypothetical protein
VVCNHFEVNKKEEEEEEEEEKTLLSYSLGTEPEVLFMVLYTKFSGITSIFWTNNGKSLGSMSVKTNTINSNRLKLQTGPGSSSSVMRYNL